MVVLEAATYILVLGLRLASCADSSLEMLTDVVMRIRNLSLLKVMFFKIIVPLYDEYSFEVAKKKGNVLNSQNKSNQLEQTAQNEEERLIKILAENPEIKTNAIAETLKWSSSVDLVCNLSADILICGQISFDIAR